MTNKAGTDRGHASQLNCNGPLPGKICESVTPGPKNAHTPHPQSPSASLPSNKVAKRSGIPLGAIGLVATALHERSTYRGNLWHTRFFFFFADDTLSIWHTVCGNGTHLLYMAYRVWGWNTPSLHGILCVPRRGMRSQWASHKDVSGFEV